jgi:multiple sugar transport system ATP-binding protein
MSFLRLSGVEKTYPDGTRAVKGVDLDVREGEFIVLLGPSGCGKTSTLRMVAGLELATGGRIELAGVDVTGLRPSARDVGFVFQFYALYPHLNVRENIAFPLRCAGVAAHEIEQRVDEVCQQLGLRGLERRRPAQLAGGDRQRVSLGRAMVRKPRVYLMDEPLGTLDADRRLEMCEFIRAQQQRLAVTTLYVTHDQEEAMSLADRIVVMADGQIRQVGTPAEVYDSPADLFVANFVGSPGMNFLSGTLSSKDGQTVFVAQGAALRVPLGSVSVPASRPVTLGVRPEYLRAETDGPITGQVILDEYLGSHRFAHVQTPSGRVVMRTNVRHSVGERVSLGASLGHVQLFDSETGKNLGAAHV